MKKIVFIFVLLSIAGFAQEKKEKKKKVSNNFGAFYLSWGYNKSVYTKSDLQILGEGYNLKFHGIKAKDRPSEFKWDVYFNPRYFTVPQFNVRAGFYIKDKYSISIGYDHMKYIIRDDREVSVSGFVDPDLNYNNLGGTHDHTPYSFTEDEFHYENSDGLNYFRFQAERTDQWYVTKKNGWFAFNTIYGLGGGFLLTFNDLTFGGEKTLKKVSISGWGLSATTGIRLDFFKHIFIQSDLIVGFHHLPKVETRHDSGDFARQIYGFASGNVSIGTMWYFKKKSDRKKKKKV